MRRMFARTFEVALDLHLKTSVECSITDDDRILPLREFVSGI